MTAEAAGGRARGDERPQGDRATIAAAIACVALVGTAMSLTFPLLSLELARMGAGGGLIGLNTATAGVASVLTLPFVPRLAAWVGTRRLLVACLVVGGLSLVAFKVFHGIVAWFPIRFALSVGLGIVFVLSEYWINAAAPAHRRGLVLGVYATVLALGFALGPALLALAGTEGWPPYCVGAGLFALGLLPPLLARGTPPEVPRHGGQPLALYLRVAPAATLAALVFGVVETGGFAILPLYGTALGLGAEHAAGLAALMSLGNVVMQIPAGLLSDRIDRRRLLFAAGVCGTLGALLMPLAARDPVGLALLLFLWGGIVGTLYTVGLGHLGARFTGADLAGANAAFVLLYTMGQVVGPPAIGAALDLAPPHGFALALAGLFAAYVVVVGWRLLAGDRGRRP